ncbi:MAG TPA: sugar phosphate isomerase/epimerase [Ktedonobacterales bacterium]|nr:sugar phosphate isomerase/epimerase [Ktedonobacterales bacterium]
MRILCSTGVFTRSSDPLSHEAILRYGPQLAPFAVDGFEVIVYPRWYADLEQVARALRASGLAFPAIHVEKSVSGVFGSDQPNEREQGIARFERNCHFARQIGASVAVFHLWELPLSDTRLDANLGLLARCLDIAERHGLELAIETIPCASADPLTNVQRAIERDARSRIALDTEFLAMSDQLDVLFDAAWLWRAGLVSHAHLKDFDGDSPASERRRFLHPGDGSIDFIRFVRQLQAAGFDGALSLEARGIDAEGRVEVARIEASLRLMAGLARESERKL